MKSIEVRKMSYIETMLVFIPKSHSFESIRICAKLDKDLICGFEVDGDCPEYKEEYQIQVDNLLNGLTEIYRGQPMSAWKYVDIRRRVNYEDFLDQAKIKSCLKMGWPEKG